jgi:hypothetical protein
MCSFFAYDKSHRLGFSFTSLSDSVLFFSVMFYLFLISDNHGDFQVVPFTHMYIDLFTMKIKINHRLITVKKIHKLLQVFVEAIYQIKLTLARLCHQSNRTLLFTCIC